jgi:hypothetical protein
MLGEGGTPLAKLLDAIREFQASEDRRFDLNGLREVIDELKYDLFSQEWAAQNHLVRPFERLERLERDRS